MEEFVRKINPDEDYRPSIAKLEEQLDVAKKAMGYFGDKDGKIGEQIAWFEDQIAKRKKENEDNESNLELVQQN